MKNSYEVYARMESYVRICNSTKDINLADDLKRRIEELKWVLEMNNDKS